MLEILLALALGVLLGIITGILPGLHPNNIIPIILGLSIFFEPFTLSIILFSTSIVNIFINFVPSTFLGAPEESTALGILPSHKLLLEGRGIESVNLSLSGCLGGIMFAIFILPLFSFIIPTVYSLIRPYTHFLLILVVIAMIKTEKNKFRAFLIFMFSGILGIISLNISENTLFPLLTGLFGFSTLLISIKEKTKIPEKIIKNNKFSFRFSSIIVGSLAGIFAGLLPGIGSTQSTLITQQILRKKNSEEDFLISIGSITASDFIFSVLSLWLIGNPRSGVAVAIGKLISVSLYEILILISVLILSGGLATLISYFLSTKISKQIARVNYNKLCTYILISLTFMTFLTSGLIGLVVLLFATAIGILANLFNVRRSSAMGCLILSTILFFAGIRI